MFKTYSLYPQGYSSAPSMFNRGCLLAFKRQASGFQHKEIFLGSTILGQTRHQGTMNGPYLIKKPNCKKIPLYDASNTKYVKFLNLKELYFIASFFESWKSICGCKQRHGAIHKRRRNILGGRGSQIPMLQGIKRQKLGKVHIF